LISEARLSQWMEDPIEADYDQWLS
jgi:hypothetical protein